MFSKILSDAAFPHHRRELKKIIKILIVFEIILLTRYGCFEYDHSFIDSKYITILRIAQY